MRRTSPAGPPKLIDTAGAGCTSICGETGSPQVVLEKGWPRRRGDLVAVHDSICPFYSGVVPKDRGRHQLEPIPGTGRLSEKVLRSRRGFASACFGGPMNRTLRDGGASRGAS